MTQPGPDSTPSNVVNELFERLGGQLSNLATSERALESELKSAAETVKEADQRQVLKEAIAQQAAFVQRTGELAKVLDTTQKSVLSDVAMLIELASSAS
jgi:hypothetical protein